MKKEINSFIRELKERKLTLAFAESVTCGLAAHKLSTCKGTSDVFKGSIVCYNEEVKINLLEIPKKMIDKYTCESAEVTKLLTKNLKNLMQADIHASLTGLASDGGTETEDKPVGTIFFCISYKNKFHSEQKHFRGSPSKIKEKACLELYRIIREKIMSNKITDK
jgi:nicotinamide-nucleotide amidase